MFYSGQYALENLQTLTKQSLKNLLGTSICLPRQLLLRRTEFNILWLKITHVIFCKVYFSKFGFISQISIQYPLSGRSQDTDS